MKVRTGVVLLLAIIGLLAVFQLLVGSKIETPRASIWTVSDALTLIYEADEGFGEALFMKSMAAGKGRFEDIAKTQAVCRGTEALKYTYRAHKKLARMLADSPMQYKAITAVHYAIQGIDRTNFDRKLHKMSEASRNRLLRNVCAIEEAFGF